MNVPVKVYFEAFSTIILAIVMNTVIVGQIFPIFDAIHVTTSLGGSFNYEAISTGWKYAFLFGLNICVIIPYLYLFNWLTKKEPKTDEMQGVYYYAS